ncbi:MAG: hypothetical protein ACLGHL_09575, partial [Actinomycetota bacterium]
ELAAGGRAAYEAEFTEAAVVGRYLEFFSALSRRDAAAEDVIERFQEVVVSLRRAKVDRDIPQAKRVPAYIVPHDHGAEVELMSEAIRTLARLDRLEIVEAFPADATLARIVTTAGIEAALDLGDILDLDAERNRLAKRIAEMDAEIDRATKKLANEGFVSKAPAAVVDKERAKLEEYRAAKVKLEAQLETLG